MMVHGRTETKSPKNVKNGYEPTSATEHVLRGDCARVRLMTLCTENIINKGEHGLKYNI
jgi:hypothetical protein